MKTRNRASVLGSLPWAWVAVFLATTACGSNVDDVEPTPGPAQTSSGGATSSDPSPDGGSGGSTSNDDPTMADIIVYQSSEDGQGNEIYIMNADSSAKTRLTLNEGVEDVEPALSPDGQQVAFTSDRDGNREIYLMNRDGTAVTRLTNAPGADYQPAFSPDGSHIAFVSERDANPEIYLMAVDGTALTRLTNNAVPDTDPAFSPGGSRIVFVSERDDAAGEIYSMGVDGTAVSRLTNNDAQDRHPAVSPDGTRIAFASDANGATGSLDLYVMNLDGTGVTLLSTAQDRNERVPAWTLDGAQIVFAAGNGAPESPYAEFTSCCASAGGSYCCQDFLPGGCCQYGEGYCQQWVQSGLCVEAPLPTIQISVMHADGTAETTLTSVSQGACDHPSVAFGQRLAPPS